ncbi:MAG: hypothetical protein ACYDDA_16030, partial [Acidiferrobacteraceae bacterium]
MRYRAAPKTRSLLHLNPEGRNHGLYARAVASAVSGTDHERSARGGVLRRPRDGTPALEAAPVRVGPQALRFISLFDDITDVWSDEDFLLVESISNIGRWSRLDEFLQMLAGAA